MSDPDPHHCMLVSTKAVLHQNGRVLLVKNARAEWDLPGGTLLRGETLKQCLARELKEELGFSVEARRVMDAFHHHVYENILVIVYECPCPEELAVSLSDEHSESRWCNLSDLPGMNMPEHYRKVVMDAAGSAGFTGSGTEKTADA